MWLCKTWFRHSPDKWEKRLLRNVELPTIRVLIVLSLNISLTAFVAEAHAKSCECKDIGAIDVTPP